MKQENVFIILLHTLFGRQHRLPCRHILPSPLAWCPVCWLAPIPPSGYRFHRTDEQAICWDSQFKWVNIFLYQYVGPIKKMLRKITISSTKPSYYFNSFDVYNPPPPPQSTYFGSLPLQLGSGLQLRCRWWLLECFLCGRTDSLCLAAELSSNFGETSTRRAASEESHSGTNASLKDD